MKVELRNVKHAAFASQETNCFEAAVYIDGVKEGFVSNEGHGGGDRFEPGSLQEKLDAYAKTLPKYRVPWDDEEHEHDAETFIGELFEDWLLQKKFKNVLKKFAFTTKGKKGLYTMKMRPSKIPADIDKILNDLPIEEAFKLFKEHACQ